MPTPPRQPASTDAGETSAQARQCAADKVRGHAHPQRGAVAFGPEAPDRGARVEQLVHQVLQDAVLRELGQRCDVAERAVLEQAEQLVHLSQAGVGEEGAHLVVASELFRHDSALACLREEREGAEDEGPGLVHSFKLVHADHFDPLKIDRSARFGSRVGVGWRR